eukprot:6473010-Amphidinium_carterae.1
MHRVTAYVSLRLCVVATVVAVFSVDTRVTETPPVLQLDLAQSLMASTTTPPVKRTRRNDRTFMMSPSASQSEPVFTKMSDVRPDTGLHYNLLCRVTFVSFGSSSQQGERKILLELIDKSTRIPMKMTVLGTSACVAVRDVDFSSIVQMHNVRCSVYRNETSFIAGDGDGFRVLIIPEEQEERFDLPFAPSMRTWCFNTIGAEENGVCNFL